MDATNYISSGINSKTARPRVQGKFIFIGEEKFYIRGVTYGTFSPKDNGNEFPLPEIVAADFAQMQKSGINSIRTYTIPPRWLLDAAYAHGLRVMVGLPWEQHIDFLSDSKRIESIQERVRIGIRTCASHPAVLCYAIGNEIPTQIVRWHGKRPVEGFLKQLYQAVKEEDPEGLVTYVNYPSTEYLELPFLDFISFNVYLESQERLEAYLARLQNIAGDLPLILAEIGLDSRRNGHQIQGESLEWQIRSAFKGGCAGTFVFAWTDEWYRGGFEIEDWDFGLTTRDRLPKPALQAVTKAFSEVPLPIDFNFPRISVVVCSYNGAWIIRDCLEGLAKLDYPNYEVIIVNDGSTDDTEVVANEYKSKYGYLVITTDNKGLSCARNTGMEAATGEIIAYLDDDAYPDPHWLLYLAYTFTITNHAGVGGPNIAPPGDGWFADCVANSPGGPVHVLLNDTVAEHIPGCNSSYRKSCLQAIGGWDPIYRTAGDDVDVCWRLQEKGWTIGFNPAAVVWHHRRNSIRTYWRQQVGYGRAEALLEKKWPEKYNALGHVSWSGRLYGKGLTQMLPIKLGRIYQGTWGSAPFQFFEEGSYGTIWKLPLMPEWFLIVGMLAIFSAVVYFFWIKLSFLWLLAPVTALALIVQACSSAAKASFSGNYHGPDLVRAYLVTAFLHLLQPLARLVGRIKHGLTMWRKRGQGKFILPSKRELTLWSEHWKSPYEWLEIVESELRKQNLVVLRGQDYDRWDLEVFSGTLGGVQSLMAVEEHGAGMQLIRFRVWARRSVRRYMLVALFAVLSLAAILSGSFVAFGIFALTVFLLVFRKITEQGAAMASFVDAIGKVNIKIDAFDQEFQSSSIREPKNGHALFTEEQSDELRSQVDISNTAQTKYKEATR